MDETMIERVARAIMEAGIGCEVTDWREAEWNPHIAQVLAEARAAIEAMREPTDSMADIAQEKYCGQPRETTVAWAKEDKWDAHRQDLIDEYQVFIDAALATPPAEG